MCTVTLGRPVLDFERAIDSPLEDFPTERQGIILHSGGQCLPLFKVPCTSMMIGNLPANLSWLLRWQI
jgi:hypothetical protein